MGIRMLLEILNFTQHPAAPFPSEEVSPMNMLTFCELKMKRNT